MNGVQAMLAATGSQNLRRTAIEHFSIQVVAGNTGMRWSRKRA
jgi:hypothetical protein